MDMDVGDGDRARNRTIRNSPSKLLLISDIVLRILNELHNTHRAYYLIDMPVANFRAAPCVEPRRDSQARARGTRHGPDTHACRVADFL